MQLAFDENGNILNTSGNLNDVSLTLQGEFYRLNSFFGIKKGLYKFDTKFGHSHSRIIGKVNISAEDLNKFIEILSEDFLSSGILSQTNYDIKFEKTSNQSVSFKITNVGDQRSFEWDFNIRNGRLSKVDNLTAISESQTYDIVSEIFTADGRSSYNLEDLYSHMLEKNNINIYETFDTQHRIYAQSSTSQTKRLVLSNEYDINLLDLYLSFYTNPPEGYQITVEMWPSPMVNLSVSDNVYILRKQQ